MRKPAPDIATVLGGGWIASGPPLASRQPLPVWPQGLHTMPREGAGEVQTPLQGEAARGTARRRPRVVPALQERRARGARRHATTLVEGDRLVGEVPTYRGEGKAFL